MKILILTGSAVRHKFVANTLRHYNPDDRFLVVSECKKTDIIKAQGFANELETGIKGHFMKRTFTEKFSFPGNYCFHSNCVPFIFGHLNYDYAVEVISGFDPNLTIVFGGSWIKDPLFSFLSKTWFINLHLGLSPYYKGAGTNFWPWVNEELEYLGATIHYVDEGIDSGDIISHVKTEILSHDDVHSVGCKIIEESVSVLNVIINRLKDNNPLPRIKQWKAEIARYYKKSDFSEVILEQYKQKLKNGLVNRYLERGHPPPKIIEIQ